MGGWTWRDEAADSIDGPIRAVEFARVEHVFFGTPEQVKELRSQVRERLRGYVNRCVNVIRRRPSQPLSQRRFHPRIERRDRRLGSTQGPSDA